MSIQSLLKGAAILMVSTLPLPVFAAIEFSEIMYDLSGADAGYEWIEIRNTGPEEVDIAGWRFFEAGVNHKLSPKGSTAIPPLGFAIIADNVDRFLENWPSFSGILFDSSFSLSNSGETLVLRDAALVDVATMSYDKSLGGGSGNSLSMLSGTWVSGTPTPGVINIAAPPPRPEEAETTLTLGNQEATHAVTSSDSATENIPGAVSISEEPARREEGNITPWIAALLTAIILGIVAIFMRKRKTVSGYTITEETS